MKLTVIKKPFKGNPVGTKIELNDRQARLLTKMGRAQYMTRDMVAAPAQVVQQAPAFVPAAAPAGPVPAPQENPQANRPPAELDSSGAAWDERVHSSAKIKNTDGTWRKRPGAKPSDAAEE